MSSTTQNQASEGTTGPMGKDEVLYTTVILKKSGQEVLVDREDLHFCRALQLGRDGIIYSRWWEGEKNVRRALHRLILPVGPGVEVDHINRNRFDNRKENLRPASRSQNACNRDRPNQKKPLKWPYKGITFFNVPGLKKKWSARVKVGGKYISGGYFLTMEEAARAYNELAKKHHGVFASLNDV